MKTLRLLLALCLASMVAAHAWESPQAGPLTDFNNDKVSELVIGIPGEDITFGGAPVNQAGAFHVVYGQVFKGLTGTGDQWIHQATSGVAGDPETFDHFGARLAVGDFDHDHNWDLAVGIPYQDIDGIAGAGAVQIFYGNGSAVAVDRDVIFSQNSAGVEGGAEENDNFGDALAVGDFNNDNFDDLAIGVPMEDIGDLYNAGAAHVLFGSAAGLTGTSSLIFYQGHNNLDDAAETDDEFGSELAAGDFDGDGWDDLAVGVPHESLLTPGDPLFVFSAGAVNVIYGHWMAGSIAGDDFLAENPGTFGLCDVAYNSEFLGGALATGYFDDDPFEDLAIGVYQVEDDFHYGAIHVVFGSLDGLNPSGDQCWDGENMGIVVAIDNYFGGRLAACDYNGDTHDDLAISMTYDSDGLRGIENHGSVIVVYGGDNGIIPITARQFMQGMDGLAETREDFDRFGLVLQGGNFNGDPYCDLAIGVPFEDLGAPVVEDAGVVQVLFGSAQGITTNGNQLWYQGYNGLWGANSDNDEFGSALAALPFYNRWTYLPVIHK